MKTMLKTIATVAAVATLPAVVANAAQLEHRWSLNGDINDSVGTATATTIGTSTTVNYIDNAAVRTGADQAGTYATALCLGSSLISGNSATLEIWATRNNHTKDMRVFDWGSGTTEYLCIGWNDSPQMWFRKNNKGITGATINNCFANDVKYHIVVTVTKDEGNSVKVDFACRNAADPSADVKRGTSTVSDWDVTQVLSANLYLGHSQWPGESGNDANATYDEVRLWSGVVPDELLALSAVMGPDVLALSYDNEGKANISIAADGILPISVSTVGNGYTLDGSVSLGAGAAIQFDTANTPNGMTFTAEGGFNVPSGTVVDYVTWTGSGKYNVTLNGNTISLSPAETVTWTGSAADEGALAGENWDGGIAPGPVNGAVISDAPDAVLSTGTADWKALTIGSVANKTGTLKVTGDSVLNLTPDGTGNNSFAAITMGSVSKASGVLEIDGGSVNAYSLNTPNFAANATVNMKSGTFNITHWVDWGRNANGNQIFNHTGGNVMVGHNLWIGRSNNGTGVWSMSGGNLYHTGGTFRLGYTTAGTKGVFVLNGGNVFAGMGIIYGMNGDNYNGTYGTMSLNGGALYTPFIKKENGTSTLILNGGTIVASNVTDSANFIAGIDQLTYDVGGLTLDTNGHDAKIVNCGYNAIGGSSLTKTGAGTLTVETLPPVETLTVSNGTLALDVNASTYSPKIVPALAHRWSFNGDLTDSAGGTTATTIGASSTVNYIDGSAVRTGADQAASYATALNLGSALAEADSVTLEIWATRNNHTKDMRVFDWGPDTKEYICIGWNDSPVMWFRKNNSGINGATINNCFSNDVKYHIVMTVTKKEDGSVQVDFVRRAVDDPSDVKSGTSTIEDWDVSKVLSESLYLGHSQWPKEVDNDANATYDEVRVWNCVLSDEAIAESCALGPDATTAQLANLVKPVTIEVASGATLDLGGNTITQRVFSCVGTLANGTLEVAKGLVVAPGQTMTVADGTTLDLSAVTEVALKDASAAVPAGGWVVATSPAGGIVSDREQLKLAGDLAGYTLFVTPTQVRIGKVGLIISFY